MPGPFSRSDDMFTTVDGIIWEVVVLYWFCWPVTDEAVVADDKLAGAFGPGARDLRIRNLRMYPFTYSLISSCTYLQSAIII